MRRGEAEEDEATPVKKAKAVPKAKAPAKKNDIKAVQRQVSTRLPRCGSTIPIELTHGLRYFSQADR